MTEEKGEIAVMLEEEKPLIFKSGLTVTVILALLYSVFVFVPANLYLRLMTGQTIAVAWFVTLIWVELSKIFGRRLSKHEAFLILVTSGGLMFVTPYVMVQRDYFVNSDIFELFGLTEDVGGLWWWAPSAGSEAHIRRTFFHSAWIMPILVRVAWWIGLALLEIGLGLLARELFIEVEDLPFPMEVVRAQGIEVITSGEEAKTRVDLLFVFGVFGFIWGFVVYALPFVIQAYTGTPISFVPIPWADFTPGIYGIERIFPGAMLGIATDILPIALAFVLPPFTLVAIVVGSFGTYFFGNWIVVSNWQAWGLPDADLTLPGIQSWWTSGMSTTLIIQRSTLYFWAVPIIGVGLAAGLVPILLRYKVFIRAIKGMIRPITEERKRLPDVISSKVILILIVGPTALGILFYAMLAPDFPIWIIVISQCTLPLMLTLVNGRMVGETGITGTFRATNIILYASGYQGVDVWFVPTLAESQGSGWLRTFKVAQLTQTTSESVLKAWLILWPIAALAGFLYMQMFWTMAPIPSGVYPGASIFWPIEAMYSALWIRGTAMGLFQPMWLIIAFIVAAVFTVAFHVAALPVSFISVAAGMGTATPFAVTYIIGLVIAVVIQRLMGKVWWGQNKMLCSAGLVMGESIAVTIAISISLILTSLWTSPI